MFKPDRKTFFKKYTMDEKVIRNTPVPLYGVGMRNITIKKKVHPILLESSF